MPDKIVRNLRTPPWNEGPSEHLVYTKAEADEACLAYRKDWWNGVREDWVLTDDGYVMQVIRVTSVDSKNTGRAVGQKTCIMSLMGGRTMAQVVGEEIVSGKLLYEPYRAVGHNYSKDIPSRPWHVDVARKRRTIQALRMYVRFMLGSLDWKVRGNAFQEVAKIYDPWGRLPGASLNRFLKTESGKEMVKRSLAELLESENITPELAMKALRKAVTIAEEGGSYKGLLEASDRIFKLVRDAGLLDNEATRGRDVPYTVLEELEGQDEKRQLPVPVSRTRDELASPREG